MSRGFRTVLASRSEHGRVLAIRRQAYSTLGKSSASSEQLRDSDDDLANCRSYLLISNQDEYAGTIRPCVSCKEFNWPPLPMRHFYPDEIAELSHLKKPIIQSSLCGVIPKYRRMGVFPTLSLLRAVCLTALAFDIDLFISLSSNRPSKLRFWGRLGLQPKADPVPYPNDPFGAVLIVGSVATMLKRAQETPTLQVLADFACTPKQDGRFPLEA